MTSYISDSLKLQREINDKCILVTTADPDQLSDDSGDTNICNCTSEVKLLCGDRRDDFLEKLSDIQRNFRSTQLTTVSDIAEIAVEINKAFKSARKIPVKIQRIHAKGDLDTIEIGLKGIKRKVWKIPVSVIHEAIDTFLNKVRSGEIPDKELQELADASMEDRLQFLARYEF